MAKLALNKGMQVDIASGLAFEEVSFYSGCSHKAELRRGSAHGRPGGGFTGIQGETISSISRDVKVNSSFSNDSKTGLC